MRRVIITIIVAGASFVTASCSQASSPTATLELPGVTTLPPVGAGTSPSSTSPARPTTTAVPESTGPTTTQSDAPPGEGSARFALTGIVFGAIPQVIITNAGSASGELTGHWIRQNAGSFEIPSVTLAPGESLAIAVGDTLPDPTIGVVAIVDAGRRLGVLDPTDGEMALFRTEAFDTASDVVDYVEWGSFGHGRSAIAVAAGIWPSGGFVVSAPEALRLQVSTPPAAGPDDWFAEIGG